MAAYEARMRMSIPGKEYEELLAAANAARDAQKDLTVRPDGIVCLLDALAAAGHQRDTATEVIENIQGKVAMYAGKYETLARKAKAMRDAQKRYSRTHDQEDLLLSRNLERDVDELLKDIAAGIPVKE